jgi:peptide/bleomycin uptake transporter
MFCEFFWARSWKTTFVAWVGMVVVVGYAFFLAHVKAQLNDFYSRFYDLLQKGGEDFETGSGAFGSGYADYGAQVTAELWSFALIVAPLVSASPAAKYVRSGWAFAWRLALMKAYLVAWDTKQEPIEGASQRLHEDSQRFATALEGCLVALLDALFTLIVFTPILLGLSKEVAPPWEMGIFDDAWLWGMAFTCSLVGLAGAIVFGQKLVGLEVANQRVEALLRKDLVLLETTPAMIVGTESAAGAQSPSRQRQASFLPQAYFKETLTSLWTNYFQLFKHFGLLNFWLTLFDQIMVLAPYVIAAPLIFDPDPARRITLGTLMKMSNSFEKVFGSLSVIAENWGAVNDFRSTYRRLREFEAKLYTKTRVGRGLLPNEVVQMTELSRPNGETAPPPFHPPEHTDIPVVDGIDPAAEAAETAARERARLRESGRHFVPIHISGPDVDPELRV